MAIYISDGKKLLDVEYDVVLDINDSIDGMRVIHKDVKSQNEVALFLLELGGFISCYVLDEEFLVGRVSGFKNLPEAIEAWNDGEI
ncbi:MAG: hypothetical protein U9N02_02220 [Campylobacterota bacterium]|nr:hypothetical protein [Campylobacterota bacterium]